MFETLLVFIRRPRIWRDCIWGMLLLCGCSVDLPSPAILSETALDMSQSDVENTPDPDLVAYWSFDRLSSDTTPLAPDESGNGHDGRVLGPTWVAAGKRAGALFFDGDASYVDVGNVDISGPALTVAAWVNIDGSIELGDRRIVSKAIGESVDDHFWMLSIYSSSDLFDQPRLRCRIKTQDSGTDTLIAVNTPLELDKWFHTAMTYDGSQVRMYVDGVLVDSLPKTGTIAQEENVPAQVGANMGGYGSWAGMIDDVVIMSRPLTQTELQRLMAMGPLVFTIPAIAQDAGLPDADLPDADLRGN